MKMSGQLEEAVGKLGEFDGETNIPGISFRAFETIVATVPRELRVRLVFAMGDAINNAQLEVGDDKHNATATAIEMRGAYQATAGEGGGDGPPLKTFERFAAGLLFPLWANKVADRATLKQYQQAIALALRNDHPVTAQALDRTISKAAKFIGGA